MQTVLVDRGAFIIYYDEKVSNQKEWKRLVAELFLTQTTKFRLPIKKQK